MSDSVTLWSVAHQTPLSMGFSRQEYRSGWSCLPPGDLPNPGIKPSSLISLALPEGSLPLVPSYNSAILILGIYLKNEKQQQQQQKTPKDICTPFSVQCDLH